MKRRAFLSIAAASCVAPRALARPRYGGVLRIQLAGPVPSFDPKHASAIARDHAFLHLTAESLTSINVRGQAEPLLAASWQSDPTQRRWSFTLRPRVVMHDGTPLTPALVADALQGVYGFDVSANVRAVQIVAPHRVPDMPVLMAQPSSAIPGTGPFHSGPTTLTAFENHWAGRPFLDSIEFLPPRPSLTPLGAAELWEVPVSGPSRRIPEGLNGWSSSPAELLAIDTTAADSNLAAALRLAIDRTAMATVLTQRQASPAATLLPQWISGYAFTFSAARDLRGAQALLATERPSVTGLTYDSNDAFARTVAERIAVNARDAGILLSTKPGPGPQLTIKRYPLSANAAQSLRSIAAAIDLPEHVRFEPSHDPDLIYGAEKILLESGRIIPVLHLPLVFGVHPKLRGLHSGDYTLPSIHLESVWMAA